MPSLSPGKRAKTWGAGPGDMGGVARVCVDCFMQRALTHWKEADAAREQQLNEAFRSWDTNGDGELQYDEWVECLSFSNPGVPTRTITKVYKAAFAGNIIDLAGDTALVPGTTVVRAISEVTSSQYAVFSAGLAAKSKTAAVTSSQ